MTKNKFLIHAMLLLALGLPDINARAEAAPPETDAFAKPGSVLARISEWAWIDAKSDDRADDGFVQCIFSNDQKVTVVRSGSVPYVRPMVHSMRDAEYQELVTALSHFHAVDEKKNYHDVLPMLVNDAIEDSVGAMAHPTPKNGSTDVYPNYTNVPKTDALYGTLEKVCKRITLFR